MDSVPERTRSSRQSHIDQENVDVISDSEPVIEEFLSRWELGNSNHENQLRKTWEGTARSSVGIVDTLPISLLCRGAPNNAEGGTFIDSGESVAKTDGDC